MNAAVIDVTKFGAKNDGSGDNAAALDAAVRELKARNGGELYFPSGDVPRCCWTASPTSRSASPPARCC